MSVVTVGAGPAASAAALTLVQAGIEVSILDRERFPRDRPGETLHPGVEPLLRTLGVDGGLHAAGYTRHPGVWSGWGEPLRFVPYGEDDRGAWRGFQAPRADFDRRLLDQATDRGARVLLGESVGVIGDRSGGVAGVMTAEGPLKAIYVIDCSGGGQTLVHHLRIPMIRHSPPLVARFGYARGRYDGPAPSICSDQDGWTWIAEVEPARFQWTRVTEPHRRPDQGWVPDPLRGLDLAPSRGADVNWRMAETVAGPGYFVAGDAAAVLDPSSSHGVLRALMSGMMAAHLLVGHLHRAVTSRECVAIYQEWLTDGFLRDAQRMRSAYRAVKLFGFGASRRFRVQDHASPI